MAHKGSRAIQTVACILALSALLSGTVSARQLTGPEEGSEPMVTPHRVAASAIGAQASALKLRTPAGYQALVLG